MTKKASTNKQCGITPADAAGQFAKNSGQPLHEDNREFPAASNPPLAADWKLSEESIASLSAPITDEEIDWALMKKKSRTTTDFSNQHAGMIHYYFSKSNRALYRRALNEFLNDPDSIKGSLVHRVRGSALQKRGY